MALLYPKAGRYYSQVEKGKCKGLGKFPKKFCPGPNELGRFFLEEAGIEKSRDSRSHEGTHYPRKRGIPLAAAYRKSQADGGIDRAAGDRPDGEDSDGQGEAQVESAVLGGSRIDGGHEDRGSNAGAAPPRYGYLGLQSLPEISSLLWRLWLAFPTPMRVLALPPKPSSFSSVPRIFNQA